MNRKGEIILGLLMWWTIALACAGGLHLIQQHYDPLAYEQMLCD